MKSIFDKKYCEQIQNQINFDKIQAIWKGFRQAGNSIQGKIMRSVFKKIMNKHKYNNQTFLDRLFDRFKQQKHADVKADKQQIDLQDLVIGMTILSRMRFLDKIKHIFELTDLDQDGCLSLEQIQAMIERVEKIFSKQNSPAKVDSYSLLLKVAHKRAERNFQELLYLLKKNNPSLSDDQQGLITCEQFIEALKCSRNLYNEENFLPLNLSLYEILSNVASQPTIQIHEQNKLQFMEFRKQIYGILQNKGEKQSSSNLIKYPGKIQIVNDFKLIQTLPSYEKQQKKASKSTFKKANKHPNHLTNDFKELYDQKLAEQTLDSYKLKVKKMIQTKTDPRLNVHFDRQVRK